LERLKEAAAKLRFEMDDTLAFARHAVLEASPPPLVDILAEDSKGHVDGDSEQHRRAGDIERGRRRRHLAVLRCLASTWLWKACSWSPQNDSTSLSQSWSAVSGARRRWTIRTRPSSSCNSWPMRSASLSTRRCLLNAGRLSDRRSASAPALSGP